MFWLFLTQQLPAILADAVGYLHLSNKELLDVCV